MPDRDTQSGFLARHARLLVCVVLVVLVWAVYAQLAGYGYIILDDQGYVFDNPQVSKGITGSGIAWAFTSIFASNWHPLSWLSHMLDVTLFGLRPGAHHLVNVALHSANAVLLFLVLEAMSTALWPSAFAAALFAIHPLHVESVAWIAERKDMLSTGLGLLAIAAYVRYTQRRSIGRYIPVAALFALSLTAKPMLVTLPCVLLLFDFWPLRQRPAPESQQTGQKKTPPAAVPAKHDRRLKGGRGEVSSSQNPPLKGGRGDVSLWMLVVEKLPLFALSAASSVVTFLVQRHGGAVQSLQVISLHDRLCNVAVSYLRYAIKTIWPSDLSIFYPLVPNGIPLWEAAAALAVLGVVTVGAFVLRRKHPYLLVGWLFYVGTLVPVVGIVQVGVQAMADRYTYLPAIGLFIMAAWGIPACLPAGKQVRTALAAGAVVAALAFAVAAGLRAAYWRDSVTLFGDAMRYGDRSAYLHLLYADALRQGQRPDDAISEYRQAVKMDPSYTEAYFKLGNALAEQQKYADAAYCYTRAVESNPDRVDALVNLGNANAVQGKLDEASECFLKAIQKDPGNADAYINVGNVRAQQKRYDEAVDYFTKALALAPNHSEACGNLGFVLMEQGKLSEAVHVLEKAQRLNPNNLAARQNLDRLRNELARRDQAPGAKK